MRALALVICILLGCAPPTQRHLPPLPREHREPTPIDSFPLCGAFTAVKPWAIDCVPRCLPAVRVRIACHESLQWHYFATDGTPIDSPWAFIGNGTCDGEPAYDVYALTRETRTAEMLDGAAGKTWEEDGADGDTPCATQPETLILNYFEARIGTVTFYTGVKVLQ